jgi:hypothetical protein
MTLAITSVAFALALTFAPAKAQSSQPCRVIHGRATFYTGDSQLIIWHVGTNHNFYLSQYGPNADASWNMLLKQIGNDGGKELFGDFDVCPTQTYKRGAAQPVTVKSIAHPYVRRRAEL